LEGLSKKLEGFLCDLAGLMRKLAGFQYVKADKDLYVTKFL
jgi:hypothetical protein